MTHTATQKTLKNIPRPGVAGHTSIPALGRQRQMDLCEFQASSGTVRLSKNKQTLCCVKDTVKRPSTLESEVSNVQRRQV